MFLQEAHVTAITQNVEILRIPIGTSLIMQVLQDIKSCLPLATVLFVDSWVVSVRGIIVEALCRRVPHYGIECEVCGAICEKGSEATSAAGKNTFLCDTHKDRMDED